jgi:hypothetical protein
MENPMNRPRRLTTLAAALVLAACSDDPTGTEDNSNLTFLQPEPTAPQLGLQTVTFNAIQGQDTEVILWYRKRPGSTDSSKVLRLRIDDDAQIVRPNGTPLSPGQSVSITITIVDPIRLIAEFQPAGLQFQGNEVADLTMWYLERDHDFNDDGVINATDTSIEQTLAIFRRESRTAPWVRLTGDISIEADEIEAEISGFTNYVIAY